MKKQNPLITDEHIVAYLDGELEVSRNFTRDLRADSELLNSAKEYAALGKAFLISSSDSRFMLSAQLDSKTEKLLADSIAKSRKTVRTAEAAPSAAPARSTPAPRTIKYLWAKRVGMGFALAGLAVSLWFNFNRSSDLITQVPVQQPSSKTEASPSQPTPQTQVPPSEQFAAKTGNETSSAPATTTAPKVTRENSHNTAQKNIAANTTSQTEAPPVIHEVVKEDPADIMISHRYAKMIKATKAVEVTQNDRVTDQM
jgi:hypothetical protein